MTRSAAWFWVKRSGTKLAGRVSMKRGAGASVIPEDGPHHNLPALPRLESGLSDVRGTRVRKPLPNRLARRTP